MAERKRETFILCGCKRSKCRWRDCQVHQELKLHLQTTCPFKNQIQQTAGLKCRSQVTGQVTGHRSGYRSHTKTIGHWTKLFLIDIFYTKNKTSQGTSIIFFCSELHQIPHMRNIFMFITQGGLALQRNQSW